MIPFLCALQFLTLCPPIIKRAFTGRELGRAVAYYPLVGLLIGLILAASNYGLSLIVPPGLRAALVLTLWVLTSGALHLDGFIDSMDGLFGGFTPPMRLEIMRDERVGAYGLAAGVLNLIIRFSAIAAIPALSPALVLIPILSRWGMAVGLIGFPYAREKGLGREIKNQAHLPQLIIASIIALIAAGTAAAWSGLFGFMIAGLLTGLSGLLILRKLPGLTGDTYGAINEMIEIGLLIAAAGGWLR